MAIQAVELIIQGKAEVGRGGRNDTKYTDYKTSEIVDSTADSVSIQQAGWQHSCDIKTAESMIAQGDLRYHS